MAKHIEITLLYMKLLVYSFHTNISEFFCVRCQCVQFGFTSVSSVLDFLPVGWAKKNKTFLPVVKSALSSSSSRLLWNYGWIYLQIKEKDVENAESRFHWIKQLWLICREEKCLNQPETQHNFTNTFIVSVFWLKLKKETISSYYSTTNNRCTDKSQMENLNLFNFYEVKLKLTP